MLLFVNVFTYDLFEHIHALLLILKYVPLPKGFDDNSLSWVILHSNDHWHLKLDEVF